MPPRWPRGADLRFYTVKRKVEIKYFLLMVPIIDLTLTTLKYVILSL